MHCSRAALPLCFPMRDEPLVPSLGHRLCVAAVLCPPTSGMVKRHRVSQR